MKKQKFRYIGLIAIALLAIQFLGSLPSVGLAAEPAAESEMFVCTGEPFIIYAVPSEIHQVDINPGGTPGFDFGTTIDPTGSTQINNLGYRVTDGLLYGWERLKNPNAGRIVKIDSAGNVTGLGNPGLPPNQSSGTVWNYNAGDVSIDGTKFYLTYSANNANGGPLYIVDLTATPPFDSADLNTLTISASDSGEVADWAVNPADGKLYGGARVSDTSFHVAKLDPTTGVGFATRTNILALPAPESSPELGFGAAWFDASGRLFLYHNSGRIYAIDDVDNTPTLVTTNYPLINLARSTTNNDGANCAAPDAAKIQLVKTADPTSVIVGGEVTYTFTVNNLSVFDSVTIDTLTDNLLSDLTSDLGKINTTTCEVTQTLDPAGGATDSYSCSVTTNLTGSAGDVITNTATASGTDANGNPVSATDTADVTLTVEAGLCTEGEDAFALGTIAGSGNPGELYKIDLPSLTTSLVTTSPANNVDDQPNAQAWDDVNKRFYYATPVAGDLYVWDEATDTHTSLGNIKSTNGIQNSEYLSSAAFYNGEYYFVVDGTDDLFKVTFSESPLAISAVTKTADMNNGGSTWFFGDFAINSSGVLYGIASRLSQIPSSSVDFFSYDLASGTFNLIKNAAESATYTNAQITFNTPVDDTLYAFTTHGVNAPNHYGEVSTIDLDTGDFTSLGFSSPVVRYRDVAGAACIPDVLALTISKTAVPAIDRTYTWTIEKTADRSELVLSYGQTYQVNYDVTVDATYSDAHTVSGVITIANDTGEMATITGVTDEISGAPTTATVDCGVEVSVAAPYTLPDGETLTCTYDAALPDGSTQTNTATVTTSGAVAGGTATEEVDFTNTVPTEIDESINVSDNKGTVSDIFLETVNAADVADAPKTIEYTLDIGPFECGSSTFVNTASFLTNDTAATGSDPHTIQITVDCENGCGLTPGYWKTHSKYGPAPEDDTWALLLEDGEDTTFFSSSRTYYEVLWTEPQGDAYYILAHTYIAAELNFLNGADPTDAQTAFDEAKVLFETYTPDEVTDAKGREGREIRNQFIDLAATLDAYNNGYIGPGSCSEEEVYIVAGGGSSMHVGDLDASASLGRRSRWNAKVTITVHDASEGAVADVTVWGEWSDGTSGSCPTNNSGQCAIDRNNIRSGESITFTVTDVTHGAFTYSAGDNHDEDDGDASDGTSITVLKP